MRHAPVVLALLLLGCGSSLSTAGAPVPAGEETDLALVQVTMTAPTRPARHVSVSRIDLPVYDAARRPDEGETQAMREAAAMRGADALVIEVLDTRWRKAIYGLGMAYDKVEGPAGDAALSACTHASALAAAKAATEGVQKCLDALAATRKSLKGEVTILFIVDPFGGVRRAAASPSSSRDTQVQACALEAVLETDFGPSEGLGCTLEVSASVGGGA